MNWHMSDRLVVGMVLVSRTTEPPFVPLVLTTLYRDIPAKRCAIRVAVQGEQRGELRTIPLADLELAPELGRWDPEKRAWFDRRNGAQVLGGAA